MNSRTLRTSLEATRQAVVESWRELTTGRDEGGPAGAPGLPDYLLVGVLVLFGVIGGGVLGGIALIVGLIQVVPLLWRRTDPGRVALVVAAGCLLQVVFSNQPHPANIAVPIVVYSAAAFGSPQVSRRVLGLGLAGAVVAGMDWGWGLSVASILMQTIFMAMFVAVAWALGDVVRRRKEVVARLQAQHRALARDQSQRQALAAQGERAAIAREMHDVVAHSLAVVVVQADGALYAARQALEQPPAIGPDRAALERAAQTLDTLAETARASLADTRRLVGVLRDEGAGAEFAPLQGLAYVEDLVQRVRESGVTVDLAVRGRVDDLPKAVDLAAYRVVQESLTNAMKHAGPDATVDVDVLRTPAVLLVRVTDDGVGLAPDADGEGNGILGMAERVEVLGGSVHAGPRSRGDWEVVATIPVGSDPATDPGQATGAGPTREHPGGRQ